MEAWWVEVVGKHHCGDCVRLMRASGFVRSRILVGEVEVSLRSVFVLRARKNHVAGACCKYGSSRHRAGASVCPKPCYVVVAEWLSLSM